MKSMWKALVVAAAVSMFTAGTALAGYTFNVTGVTVGMSCPGDAYYDGGDDSVTVEPYFDWCTLKVTCTPLGTAIWGWYADVFILADDTIVKGIAMKGTNNTWFYTVGQTYDCLTLKGAYTNIGDTDAYGTDVGLGMDTSTMGWVANAISLKVGVCWAACLAQVFFDKGAKGTLDEVLPAAGQKMLLER